MTPERMQEMCDEDKEWTRRYFELREQLDELEGEHLG